MRRNLLVVTAVLEAGAGLGLVVAPEFVLRLLFGLERAAVEALLVSRLAGAALVSISIACWAARADGCDPAQLGLVAGLLVYNVAAAALLAWAGAALQLQGIALWPGVGLHVVMTCWCLLLCVVRK
jgi:hypothetical protein